MVATLAVDNVLAIGYAGEQSVLRDNIAGNLCLTTACYNGSDLVMENGVQRGIDGRITLEGYIYAAMQSDTSSSPPFLFRI